ncbi:hypothetical protein [Pontibacter anaerobius]|uniref:Outer membrane protein beta-barrel domain-containing protein n=1 Tax=Pontibacter anaerobius TaxID=2993940 RepID=A0ABT3RGV4_9BACT|nr:hypothetical protein [Pontibacter anaerobius]MCX2740485.1 hypothetical protein [Pontibacter anaerobius]
MKTKLLFPLLGALSYFAGPALAQTDDVPSSKPQAVAPYKTSLGFRTTWGGPSGIDSELRLKHFVGPQSALELQVGQWHYQRAYQASLHYLWQPQLLTSSRLRPYAGLGIGAVGGSRDRFNEKQDMEVGAMLLASVGIEYTFPRLPLAISVDYRHMMLGLNTNNFEYFGHSRISTLGVGLKYTFGK